MSKTLITKTYCQIDMLSLVLQIKRVEGNFAGREKLLARLKLGAPMTSVAFTTAFLCPFPR